jgi:threonine/homoserine efflux transporter RhtA
MDPRPDARPEVASELRALADEFARSDEAAFRRSRILCWIVTAVVTLVILLLLISGADWRYLGAFWIVAVGVTWVGYGLSGRRQRQQTERLRALANRWLTGEPPP